MADQSGTPDWAQDAPTGQSKVPDWASSAPAPVPDWAKPHGPGNKLNSSDSSEQGLAETGARAVGSGVVRVASDIPFLAAGIASNLGPSGNPVSRDISDKLFGLYEKGQAYAKELEGAPQTTVAGKAAQFVGGLPAGIASLGADSIVSPAANVLKEGGSFGEAYGQLGLNAAANAAGLGVGNIGKTIAQRAFGQGAANVALGEASRRVGNAMRGPDQQQEFDPVEAGLQFGTGAAFGAVAGKHGPSGDAQGESQPQTGYRQPPSTNFAADENGFLKETPSTEKKNAQAESVGDAAVPLQDQPAATEVAQGKPPGPIASALSKATPVEPRVEIANEQQPATANATPATGELESGGTLGENVAGMGDAQGQNRGQAVAEAPEGVRRQAEVSPEEDQVSVQSPLESRLAKERISQQKYDKPFGELTEDEKADVESVSDAIKLDASEPLAMDSRATEQKATEAETKAPVDDAQGDTSQSASRATGVKNATIDEERTSRGLDELEALGKRSSPEAWDSAKDRLKDDPYYGENLARSIVEKSRPISAEETFALTQDRARLQNEYRDVQSKIEEAMSSGDKNAEDIARAQQASIEEKLQNNEQAAKNSNYEKGFALAANRLLSNEDYSMARLITRAKVAIGDKLPDSVREKITSFAKQIEEKDAQIAQQQAKIAEMQKAGRRSDAAQPRKSVNERAQSRLKADIVNLEKTIKERLAACPI